MVLQDPLPPSSGQDLHLVDKNCIAIVKLAASNGMVPQHAMLFRPASVACAQTSVESGYGFVLINIFLIGVVLIWCILQGKVISKRALLGDVAGSDTHIELLAVPRKEKVLKVSGAASTYSFPGAGTVAAHDVNNLRAPILHNPMCSSRRALKETGMMTASSDCSFL
jgi:hypothetical protein